MKYKRRYENQTKQNAYENACDCHYFGMGESNWNDCGVSVVDHVMIWDKAFEDVANNNFAM